MEGEVRDYEDKIMAERARLAKAAGTDQEPIQIQIKALEIESSDISLQITKMAHTVEQIGETIEAGREEFLKRQREVRGIEEEISNLRKDLAKLQGAKGNDLYAFEGATQIRREIDAHKNWISKPLGPIGSFVKIKREFVHFASVIDSLFGQHLNAWVVNNPQDREQMMKILKRVGSLVSFLVDRSLLVSRRLMTLYGNSKSTVISERQDSRFDYSRGEPSNEHLTVLRALEVRPNHPSLSK